jgi:hypothetical protein
MKDAGYEPVFLGMLPQLCIESYSMGLVNNFELALPAERQAIPQETRVIPRDELAKKEPLNSEYRAMRKALGLE